LRSSDGVRSLIFILSICQLPRSKSDTPCKTMHALVVEKMGEKIKSRYVNLSNQRATQRSMLTLHCGA